MTFVTFENEIENVIIGKKLYFQFLLNYKSFKRIRDASLEELEDALNKWVAKTGYDYFSAESISKYAYPRD